MSVPFPFFFWVLFWSFFGGVQFEQRGLVLSGVLLLSLIGLCRFSVWGEEGVMKIEWSRMVEVSSLTMADMTLDSVFDNVLTDIRSSFKCEFLGIVSLRPRCRRDKHHRSNHCLTLRQQATPRLLVLLSVTLKRLGAAVSLRCGPLRGCEITHIGAFWAPTQGETWVCLPGAKYLWVLLFASVHVLVSSPLTLRSPRPVYHPCLSTPCQRHTILITWSSLIR